MQGLSAFGNGIYAVDSGYTGPDVAAIHLIEEGGRAALVDTGNNDALVHVEQALAATGLSPEAVDFVLLTHIHLDHAGGAGAFMRAFPNAKLVVHPRGARHMVEPSKLFAGVSAVYGPERARELYGELIPVPAERIVEATDGLELDLAGRVIRVFDTPLTIERAAALAGFVQSLDATFGGFREKADRTYELLKRPGTRFVVVSAAEPDALREASFFVDRLSQEQMPLAGLILNRTHPMLCDLTADADRGRVLHVHPDARHRGELGP